MAAGPFVTEFDSIGLTASKEFDTKFKAKMSAFPKLMGFAVVDLTTGLPQFSGTELQIEKHVYSLAKICPLLAAFRLQERLRNSFSTESAAVIEKAWSKTIQEKNATGVEDFPKLNRIFKPPATAGGKWDFDFQTTNATWDTLQGYEGGQKDSLGSISKAVIDRLGFLDRLKLCVRMSDGNAAGSVIEDLGFAFINATLQNEGYYDSKKHGLWVGSSYSIVYANRVYKVEPTGDDITVGGTSDSVALFMTRLHRGTLVKDYGKYKPSDELRDIMEEKPKVGTGSRFARGVPRHNIKFSKIGLGIPLDKCSEGAIIERQMTTKKGAAKTMRYVAVALQSMEQPIMGKIAKAMDTFIEEMHLDDK